MKIGIFGNMNNIMFSIYRYLIDNGYDVKLFLLPQEPPHFKPEEDSFEHSNNDFTLLDWNYGNLYNYKKENIEEVLNEFDFIIAHGIAIGYCGKVKRKIDLLIPYGNDIWRMQSFWQLRQDNSLKRNIKLWYYTTCHKTGLNSAINIMVDIMNPLADAHISRMNKRVNRIRMAPPMLYLKQYEHYKEKYYSKSKYYQDFELLRNKYEFVIFQHTRQMWKNIPSGFNSNGNNYLIEGFSKLVINNNINSCLILFEYGNDVEESKNLINTLGIKEKIIWMPLMARKELMFGLLLSDVYVGELYNSYLSYGALFEAFSMKTPVIHKRIDHLYKDHYDTLYPNIYADSSETVYKGLLYAYNNRDELKKMATEAHEWLKNYVIQRAIFEIEKLIKNTKE